MIIRAKAPFRISFAGGGTDVPPYCWEYGGAVVSTTIDKYAYVTLRPTGARKINVCSIDFNLRKSFMPGKLKYNGQLDLVKATINEFDIKGGFNLMMHADMPAGSGMGTSSSMAVALIGCLKEFVGKRMNKRAIAELAYHIEREELKEKGGYQDQYAAAFGGFNYIEFRKNKVTVTPLRLSPELSNELQYRMLLFFTGETRLSSEIHEDMARRYREEKGDYLTSMHNLKRIAGEMKRCLLKEDTRRFGELLHEGWVEKRRLSDKITNPEIEMLYEVARRKGAIGGKILGAGGGGHLLVFCEPMQKFKLMRELIKHGAREVPFGFEPRGLQTWRIGDENS
jgi:D-glycero-alpha-D-manno-heptose-7-phosphate kinase